MRKKTTNSMDRIPSIHVPKLVLVKWIEDNGPITLDNLDAMMTKARQYSIESRSIQVTNKKMAEKVLKRTSSVIADANLVSDMIYAIRIQLKHLGVIKIKQTDNQWGNVKELATIISEFCEAKDLSFRQGCISYITIGLSLIALSPKPNYSYCAKWMVQKASWIISEYESNKELIEDTNETGTKEIHDIYVREVAERTGIYHYYSKNKSDMLFFLRARELADEIGVDYENFIQAQFFALEFCNGIPRPQDISGDKAKDRLIKYIGQNNIVLEPQQQKTKVDWSQFKK